MAKGTESTNKHHWDAPGVSFVVGVFGAWGIGISLLVENIVGVGAILCLGSTVITIIRYFDLFKSPIAARRRTPVFEAALIYTFAAIEISLPLILLFPKLFPPPPSLEATEAAQAAAHAAAEAAFRSNVELSRGLKISITASGDDAESVRDALITALRARTGLTITESKDGSVAQLDIRTRYLPVEANVFTAKLKDQIRETFWFFWVTRETLLAHKGSVRLEDLSADQLTSLNAADNPWRDAIQYVVKYVIDTTDVYSPR